MERYTVVGQFHPGDQIITQPNSTASSWVDFRELVAAQDVDILDKGKLASEALLTAMDQHRSGRAKILRERPGGGRMTAVADNGLNLEL
jgi:hypothetical protein